MPAPPAPSARARPRRRRGSPRRRSPWRARHVLLAGRRQDRDLVGVDVEADVAARDVVDDDRVQPLLVELARACSTAPLAVLGGEADERLPGAAIGSERAEHVGRRLELQPQPLAAGLLELAARRRGAAGSRRRRRPSAARRRRGTPARRQLCSSAAVPTRDADARVGAAARRSPRSASPRLRARAASRAARGPYARRSCCRGSARCRSARACRRR